MTRMLIALVAILLLHSTSGRTQSTDSLLTADTLLTSDTTTQVDIAAQIYVQKCVGCHTVGGGKLTGPDLLATRAWPKAELAAKVKLMEPRVGPLTENELNQFVELLQDARAQDRIHIAQELAGKAVAATLEPASENIGKKLFEGTTQLAGGGIACITCHRAGMQGGTFGPDLTNLHSRMGKVAMISAIQQTQFLVMSGIYKNQPVTAQEAVHLSEYLSHPELMPTASMEDNSPVIGAVLGVFSLLVVVGLYRKRTQNAYSHERGMA